MLHQLHHQVFLLGQALGHQQRQRHQGVVVDQPFHRAGQQVLVQAQVAQEQEGAGALVAIGQRMVLDHEIQQMRRPARHVGVEQLLAKALLDGGDTRGQPVAAQLSEQLGRFALGDQLRLELGDGGQHRVQRQRAHLPLSGALPGQALLVVALQQAPAAGVVADHLQHRPAFVIHQLLLLQRARQQAHRLLALDAARLEAPLVEGVARHQMLAQHPGGPLAKACGAGGIDPVADADDGVEVEVLHLIGFAVGRSCCIFCNYSLPRQLATVEDILQVPGDHRLVATKQAGQLLQAEPHRLTRQAHFHLVIVSLEDLDVSHGPCLVPVPRVSVSWADMLDEFFRIGNPQLAGDEFWEQGVAELGEGVRLRGVDLDAFEHGCDEL